MALDTLSRDALVFDGGNLAAYVPDGSEKFDLSAAFKEILAARDLEAASRDTQTNMEKAGSRDATIAAYVNTDRGEGRGRT